MQRKSLSGWPCPVARGLDRVGDWWSILILRDAFRGLKRFDEFQNSLRIAPNMLTRRLSGLVEDGLLERRLYSEKPPRHDYLLTPAGRDFWPVLVAMGEWGNRHFSNDGIAIQIVDAKTGAPTEAVVIDRISGRVMDCDSFRFGAGPAASDILQRRMAATARERKKAHG